MSAVLIMEACGGLVAFYFYFFVDIALRQRASGQDHLWSTGWVGCSTQKLYHSIFNDCLFYSAVKITCQHNMRVSLRFYFTQTPILMELFPFNGPRLLQVDNSQPTQGPRQYEIFYYALSSPISILPACLATTVAPAVPNIASSLRLPSIAFSSAMKQHNPALLSISARE